MLRAWRVIDSYFGVTASGSSFAGECRAGATTFLTMAYILFANPAILSDAIVIEGRDSFSQLMCATALAAAVGSLLMGLMARYPFALAPGMGLNAYFTYTVVIAQGVAWPTALGAVFISGLLFVVLSVIGLRDAFMAAIPQPIKRATAAGIGLFLAIIGCRNAGLVVDHPVTLVSLGDLGSSALRIAGAGLLVMVVLLSLKWRGAVLLGIASASLLAVVSGAEVFAGQSFKGFEQGLVALPAWPVDLFLRMDVPGALRLDLLGVIVAFLFVDLLDTAGTLFGLADRAGYLDDNATLPRATHAFTADAIATSCGAVLGTSPTTSYIESASGIEDGGRTGLTAVAVAVLFLLSLFFWPVAAAIPAAATAPALIVVGAMMMSAMAGIRWQEYRISVPVFLTMIGMPLTYSIANGLALGLCSYTLIHLFIGRGRELNWLMYLVTSLILIAAFI